MPYTASIVFMPTPVIRAGHMDRHLPVAVGGDPVSIGGVGTTHQTLKMCRVAQEVHYDGYAEPWMLRFRIHAIMHLWIAHLNHLSEHGTPGFGWCNL